MTDITELALLVSKAKASVFTMEYISQFDPADIDSDDVDLRFEVDGRDTGTNVSIVDECGQAAKVIVALVEALETKDADAEWMRKRIAELAKERETKEDQRANWFQMAQKLGEDLDAAEKRITELENDEVRQRLANAEHQLHMAGLRFHNIKASRNTQFKKRKVAERRVAELEESHAQVLRSRDHYKRMSEEGLKQLAESRTVTVKLPNQTQFDDPLSAYEAIEKCKEALTAEGIKWEANHD